MSEHNNEHAFSIQGLVKRYPGFNLGPIDLDLQPGVVLGLIGPNGAGKTTTLHCLIGLLVPEAGQITVFGRANHPDDPRWRQDIGVVGEESGFYLRWTVEENLRLIGRFQPNWSDQRAQRMAERFSLPLTKRVNELSKGNKAKLAIVAALGHAPRLLILDEPTAGLDPLVRAEVLDMLWELQEDGEHAIFYSTHVLSDIERLADELVFLSDGRILQRSAKDDLVESWRRISFRLAVDNLSLPGVIDHRQVRLDHQVTSRDHEATLQALHALGAESIEQARMSIDEIAVEILKEQGASHVANH
jgi:ABC-2 type transport system ATP-binding protein